VTAVAVVGGGPAGLAAAIACRRHGLGVTVIERGRAPIDKACGEGLLPEGVAALARLGVGLDGAGAMPIAGIRYLDRDVVADGRFRSGRALGIRRTRLHAALARRAEQAGVDLRWNTPAGRPGRDGVPTASGVVHADWVIAADGLHSPIRRAARLERPAPAGGRFGIRRHYAIAPWSDLVEVHWADGTEAYVTPVAPDEVGVALLFDAARALGHGAPLPRAGSPGPAPFDRLLSLFPRLLARLEGAAIASSDRGSGPMQRRARAVSRGRLALFGDAAGSVDALTGEGMSLAFRLAQPLADAVAAGDLSLYARAHARVVAGPHRLTRLLLFVEKRPGLRRQLIRALAARPDLFSDLLGMLTGAGGAGPFTTARMVLRLALAT
jgi:flavin-dependent dehydrogenase